MSVKVSIIIPIYNAESKLKRCINSILSQTYSDFELILVDDGSTDSSAVVCKEIYEKDKRIRYYKKENSGASDTRNYGIKRARGEYIAFSDADDWVEPSWLASMVENIYDTDLVIQGYICHALNGEIRLRSINNEHIFKDGYSCACRKLMDKAHMGYLWSMLFKNNIIRDNNLFLYKKMSFQEDLDFILRYLIHTKSFKTIEICAYHYNCENKRYFHNVSGCYSISLSLDKLLYGDDIQKYKVIYRTNTYSSLLFHCVSNYEIKRAKCYLKKFGRPCNGYKANISSYLLLLFPISIVKFLLKILRFIIKKNNEKKRCKP